MCPAGRGSRGSARRPTFFSCFAKQSRQKKATPMMAVRAAHGLHTPPAPKSGSVGTRCAQTADASDPISALAACRHRRGFTAESKAASTATATATATATVATRNVKGNCNCRCASNSNSNSNSNSYSNSNGELPPVFRLPVSASCCLLLLLLHPALEVLGWG